MKLLVVGHTYFDPHAQYKFVEMKKHCPGLQLCVIVPERLPWETLPRRRGLADGMERSEVLYLPIFMGVNHMCYLVHPLALLRVLWRMKPHIVHLECDPHSFVSVETVLLCRLVARNAQITFFIWDNLNRKPWFALRWLKWAFTRICLSAASLVICGNQEAQRILHLQKKYRKASTVLPQIGLNAVEYSPSRAESRATRATPVVGYFGRLVDEKGLEYVLGALERLLHLPWRMMIVGSGPFRRAIEEEWMARLGGRLELKAAVGQGEIPRLLDGVDVFVLASKTTPFWAEQFGLALAQAMLAGIPCIGSDSGAIPQVIGPGGLVFPEGDIARLTECLSRLLTSPEERRRLGQAGHSYAMERYTSVAVGQAYVKAFNGLLGHLQDGGRKTVRVDC